MFTNIKNVLHFNEFSALFRVFLFLKNKYQFSTIFSTPTMLPYSEWFYKLELEYRISYYIILGIGS